METGLARFMAVFRNEGVTDRVRLLHPTVADGNCKTDTMVHSKVMIVDDMLLRVGSANLNNRSFGLDTECDLVFQATSAEHRRAIGGLRNRMLGHFCGVTESEVAAFLADGGSLIEAAGSLSKHGHKLEPIELCETAVASTSALEEVADPERPISPPEFLKNFVGERPRARRVGRLAKVLGAGLFVVALVLAWHLTPLAELTDPRTVDQWIAWLADMPAAPAMVLVIFVVAGLIAFPVTLLIAATAAAFGPWLGFAYAGVGAVTSAVVAYGAGRLIGRSALENLLGPRLNRIRRGIARRGVVAIAAVRMVPIAPFTVVNLAAGASRIPLSDYIIGTILGMTPGLVLMSALGSQILNVITRPTAEGIALFAVAVVAWLGVSLGTQALVIRYRSSKA
jgi:uncharacterized membrane protein YdjX (TVP38/TMEM64 family)